MNISNFTGLPIDDSELFDIYNSVYNLRYDLSVEEWQEPDWENIEDFSNADLKFQPRTYGGLIPPLKLNTFNFQDEYSFDGQKYKARSAMIVQYFAEMDRNKTNELISRNLNFFCSFCNSAANYITPKNADSYVIYKCKNCGKRIYIVLFRLGNNRPQYGLWVSNFMPVVFLLFTQRDVGFISSKTVLVDLCNEGYSSIFSNRETFQQVSDLIRKSVCSQKNFQFNGVVELISEEDILKIFSNI